MLRTLLIIFIIILIVRLIQSYLKPSKKSQSYNPYRHDNYSNRREGDTYIQNSNRKKEKKIPKNEGDYIDYEDA